LLNAYEGGLGLGEGGAGDSNGTGGSSEGAVMAGETTNATDDAIQKSIVSIYGKCSSDTPSTAPRYGSQGP
jgi:hypothetical protein